MRALTKRQAEEMFQSLGLVLSPGQLKRLKQILLQQWGIVLFDHPEIRQALGLSDAQAANFHSIHEQIYQEIVKQASDGRISQQDARKQVKSPDEGDLPGFHRR